MRERKKWNLKDNFLRFELGLWPSEFVAADKSLPNLIEKPQEIHSIESTYQESLYGLEEQAAK